MFKNVMIYRIGAGWSAATEQIEAALSALPFAPCAATQDKSVGWVPPRGQAHGALVEPAGPHRILCFQIETKAVPGAVIKRHLEQRVAAIEAKEGRKPGRKESRDLREQIVHELLPMAFAKTASVMVWLDQQAGRLVLDTSSQTRADEVVTALVRGLDGLQLSPFHTQLSPQAAMTTWLTGSADDWPAHFAPGREVELKSADEMKSVVKFTRHPIDDELMRLHIGQGKLPTKLALEWNGRVGFVLSESTVLGKVAFLDGVFEDHGRAEDEGGFDADVAIATGELSALISDLSAALGGELR